MGIVLFIGLFIPIIYIMRVVQAQRKIDKQVFVKTLIYSLIGAIGASIIIAIVGQQGRAFYSYLISGIIVGIIWTCLLCGCYAIYQRIGKKFK
ncbi:hypothetical protein [Staphylococcus arlettae]|uniref:hypothetical protein n=1 Tax=Staphylococcus arlettae TaxID=29378 RepID=UPI001E3D9418|nr:hypothetical protein [Staphylococcus arlettae]MCD8862908.1 hypothetical protein [Staphylococcus arlettae]